MPDASQIRLGLKDGPDTGDFIFPLGPNDIEREYGASYVQSPVARADWAPSYVGPPAAVWARNTPERIHLGFLLINKSELGQGQSKGDGKEPDVEDDIRKLESFRYRSDRTGEPPDLILTIGKDHDLVRIERMTMKPKLFTNDLRRRQVNITMELIVIRPRA